MASFKISIFLMMTSVIIHVQAHGLRRQKKHENNYSGFEHGTTKNNVLRKSYSWTHDLGDSKVHETATVNQLTQTVVMASTDRLLLQRDIRPSVTFHDFKTGLIAIKIRNKFKGHHKGYGGKHARRAQSTCYIVPVRTSFTETRQQIASRNGKIVVFRSSPRHFVTCSSTMTAVQRSAFRRKSHFLSTACHSSAIVDSQNMKSGVTGTTSGTTEVTDSTTVAAPECTSCPNIDTVPSGFQSVTYTPSNELLQNPGRGFFRMFEALASTFWPLTVSELDAKRASNGLNNILRVYILDSYVDSAIPASFLDKIRADLVVVSDAGWTMALRFHYTRVLGSPDATKAIMLQHISQIGPVLHEYEEFISVIQAGFIGTWGEWYYTTHFGIPPLTAQNWQDRKDIVMAMMNSFPQSIPIQLRTPEYKFEICDTTTAATLSDVEQHNCVGRAGQHNDCFLASDTDVGTYNNPTTEKAYLAQDTRYLPMSGETCAHSVDASNQPTTRSDCPTAVLELAAFHWTLLHDGYHPGVLADWKTQGCFDDISERLGYRLALKKAVLPTTAQAGGEVCYHIVMENTGYAAPYKTWTVALVFKPQSGGQYYAADLDDVDVRTWLPGAAYTLSGTVQLPSAVGSGTYDMFLVIYEEKTKHLANYYILLANTNVPQYTEGLNSLQASIQVSGVNSATSTCTSAAAWTAPTAGTYSRVLPRV